LKGGNAILATLVCLLPFLIGFVLPVGVMGDHALANMESWTDEGLIRALTNTVTVGAIAAVITVLAGVFLVYGVRLSGQSLPKLLLPLTTIGYAAPGAVLGVGILIPLAFFDHRLAELLESIFGGRFPLILTGSAFALVLAYCVRFFAIAQGASGLGRALLGTQQSAGSGRGLFPSDPWLHWLRTSVGLCGLRQRTAGDDALAAI
jgi:iron(III) transport system permease protein